MIPVALPRGLAAEHSERIQAAASGRVRLLPLRGEEGEAGLDEAEIAVYGYFDGPLSFAELIERMPRLRWIHSTGAGMDEFVSPAIGERGIALTNSSGIYAPAMVEYAIAGMVAIVRDFRRLLAQQAAGEWRHEPVSGRELHGRRLGIVGYGLTGRALAQACKALGMEVWATRRTAGLDFLEPVDRLLPLESLHDLLASSDFLAVLSSLNSTSRHLLGEAELRAVKPGAVLVNLARGGLVDPDALLAAVRDGRLRGAVLDVTEPEPLPPESPLWHEPNVIVTPHISGGSPEGWTRSMELFCRNLPLYLDGEIGRMGNLVELADHL